VVVVTFSLKVCENGDLLYGYCVGCSAFSGVYPTFYGNYPFLFSVVTVKIRKSHAQLGPPEGAGIKSLDNERVRVTLRLTISRSVLVSSPVCGSGPDFSLSSDLTYLSL
jgi:hypothetical protein